MMNRIIEVMKRGARITAFGVFAATLIPTAAGARTADRPIDIGAALLMPADAADLGYEDYGVDLGSLYTLEQLIRESNLDADITSHEIDLYGITAITNLTLDPIADSGETGGPLTSFYSVVTSYTDENFAEVDFESIREDYATGDEYEMLDDHAGIGNDSLMVREEYESEEDGAVTIVTVAFLIDNVEAEVSVIGYDEEVDVDLVTDAATVVEGKINALLEGGEINGQEAPGLSLATPRYEGDELHPGRSEYVIYNGEAIVNAYDPDSAEVLQGRADGYGIVGQYATSLEYQLGDELSEEDPLLRARVTRFADAGEAERYVDERAVDVAATGGVRNLEEIDVPANTYDGGAIAAMTYEIDYDMVDGGTGTNETTRLFIQDGRYVYDLSLAGFTSPDLDVMTSMIDDLLDCGQNGCIDTIKPPAELMTWFEGQREYWLDESGSKDS